VKRPKCRRLRIVPHKLIRCGAKTPPTTATTSTTTAVNTFKNEKAKNKSKKKKLNSLKQKLQQQQILIHIKKNCLAVERF